MKKSIFITYNLKIRKSQNILTDFIIDSEHSLKDYGLIHCKYSE